MITLRHIYKNYFTPHGTLTALADINLHINHGEIYGIIGKSGAGKSTLIRCVNLLERPTQGQVIVNGETLTNLTTAQLRHSRQKIGMIFQHFNLLTVRTVYENVALPLVLARHKNIAARVMQLLDLTGLSDKKNNYPAQLSGGQKQRVAIARALACEPAVLLSDEATSALDPETTLTILKLLKDIRDNLNLTILLITHEMSVIKNCCDRVAILQAGKMIEENEVGQFFTHPQTELARNFIASSMLQNLPEAIESHVLTQQQPHTHPIIRLWFLEGTATQPLISELTLRYQLQVNILQANVEYIKKHAMGMMMVALKGESDKISSAVQYLNQLGVKIEIIGYVPDNIIAFN